MTMVGRSWVSCLSTTWFRFLFKLGCFFGKHLNEAQKGVSDLECYNATVFVRNNEDARVGTCESTCLSQETPWRGAGHAWDKSEQRDQQAQSKSTACLGAAFPKRNSSSQILVLRSASNNEILKNSWQENIKNKTKQKQQHPGLQPTPKNSVSQVPGTDIFKASPAPTPGDSPTGCPHRPRVATEHLSV